MRRYRRSKPSQNTPRFLEIVSCVSQYDNRFVRPFLTASAVITVMPVRMLIVPNLDCRNEWPLHCARRNSQPIPKLISLSDQFWPWKARHSLSFY
jgi:hypothetical protein